MHVGRTSRGGMRGNKKFNFEFKIKMAFRYSQEVSRKQDIRDWSFMFQAWAKDIIWGVISIFITFKAMSLHDITKIVSLDRDKKLYKDPKAF